MRVELPEARYRQVEPQTRFREQVLENMNALPGVQAAMISEMPLGGTRINHNFIIERPASRSRTAMSRNSTTAASRAGLLQDARDSAPARAHALSRGR